MTKLTLLNPEFRCATVAILGRPNAGKSTLLNALLETPVSATSKRPQTTRSNIRGILQRYTGKGADKQWSGQLIFIDTPGVNFQKGLLERSMYSAVEGALKDVDVTVWLADARTFEKDLKDLEMKLPGGDKIPGWLRQQMKNNAAKTKGIKSRWILALNKVDMLSKNELLPLMERVAALEIPFDEVVPVSALAGLKSKNSNLDSFLGVVEKMAPQGPALFHENDWTDLQEIQLIQNLVRESLFRQGREELPYLSDCSILQYLPPEGKKKMAEVDATIWVAKDSLKPIVVGNKGSRIRELNKAVRDRYKEITGEDVVLRMVVKVVEKWNQRPNMLGDLGYELGQETPHV